MAIGGLSEIEDRGVVRVMDLPRMGSRMLPSWQSSYGVWTRGEWRLESFVFING